MARIKKQGRQHRLRLWWETLLCFFNVQVTRYFFIIAWCKSTTVRAYLSNASARQFLFDWDHLGNGNCLHLMVSSEFPDFAKLRVMACFSFGHLQYKLVFSKFPTVFVAECLSRWTHVWANQVRSSRLGFETVCFCTPPPSNDQLISLCFYWICSIIV